MIGRLTYDQTTKFPIVLAMLLRGNSNIRVVDESRSKGCDL